MSKLKSLLQEYGESHQNETNKLIHWICVPAIFFSLVGLLHQVKFPVSEGGFYLSLAIIVLALAVLYYFRLSNLLGISMIAFGASCIFGWIAIENNSTMQPWIIAVTIFVLAWIGQFYGHKVEGKKPFFLKDLQFLLTGPAWLMNFIFLRFSIKLS